MNTPAHLLLAAVVFARPGRRKRNAAALVGAFIPDASLYFMVFFNGIVRGFPTERIFGYSYYHPFWQSIFAVDNSFFVWSGLFTLGLLLRWFTLVVFAGAGFLHLATDFPLHHDDGRAHFWPATDWIFESPVSYWDPNAYGWFIAPLELALCIGIAAILFRRFEGTKTRIGIALAISVLVLPQVVFLTMFG